MFNRYMNDEWELQWYFWAVSTLTAHNEDADLYCMMRYFMGEGM
jgi:hypothetical protein